MEHEIYFGTGQLAMWFSALAFFALIALLRLFRNGSLSSIVVAFAEGTLIGLPVLTLVLFDYFAHAPIAIGALLSQIPMLFVSLLFLSFFPFGFAALALMWAGNRLFSNTSVSTSNLSEEQNNLPAGAHERQNARIRLVICVLLLVSAVGWILGSWQAKDHFASVNNPYVAFVLNVMPNATLRALLSGS